MSFACIACGKIFEKILGCMVHFGQRHNHLDRDKAREFACAYHKSHKKRTTVERRAADCGRITDTPRSFVVVTPTPRGYTRNHRATKRKR